MIWHRLKLSVIAGTIVILGLLMVGTALLAHRGLMATRLIAEADIERSAQGVENALNRQLLQIHGALAAIRPLFAAAGVTATSPAANELLRGFNLQTIAYRDMMLVAPDGTIIASARPRGALRSLPMVTQPTSIQPAAMIGPVQNPVNGDWSLYAVRAVPGWNGVVAVADVSTQSLMKILAETGLAPGMRIRIERPNGQLVASLPHDELAVGEWRHGALGTRPPDGRAFVATGDKGQPELAVVRSSLPGDLRVVLVTDLDEALAPWRRFRDRLTAAAAMGGTLVTAFAGALFLALRQRERVDAERARATAVLANAVEAMSDGFALWDGEDRLVACNQRYRELFAITAPFLTPGARFQEIMRASVAARHLPTAGPLSEEQVAERARWHRPEHSPVERRLSDGRWLLMTDRRTADGGVVAIRTDVTALKAVQAELAEANLRATEAAAEAQRQNMALIEREGRIRFLAHHDDLTGLPNRVVFRERIGKALYEAAERGEKMALLYLDLDRFKDVNDTLGHPVGDALLRKVAARLTNCVQATDVVARLSGDEFAIISIGPQQPQAATELAERIIALLGEPYSALGHTIAVSVSVGIAVAEAAWIDADTLLKQADLALYRAKAWGRGTLCVFEPEMDTHLRARLEMEQDLREALAEGQFDLAYQPIFSVVTGALTGFEALLRWNHPRRGIVEPSDFVPLAEDSRSIVEIGAFVLRRAVADIAALPGNLKVAVNLSPVQLAFGDIVGTVEAALRDSGLPPGRLECEITETALFESEQTSLAVLQRLREIGVKIVLDDFGTGYSSLSRLRLLPLDKIKIDRSFVQDATEGSASAAIVEAITVLTGRLGIATVAEGIETEAQWALLVRTSCAEAQGFLLGRPLPIAEAAAMARDGYGVPVALAAGFSAPP
ncbi:bifunctional diguanylate cyclase/phosphodiesterase [Xanthobacter aminoxidans]|uniref:bifunctional diguanylate cyclase/phosphodiesterase n=1 Tax=Xanthobacter aminoxidans TaxID=186280 RepID=UPI0037283255